MVGMAARFLGLFKVCGRKRNTSPADAPAQHPEELEQFQPLQDDAAVDQTQERKPARGRFRRTLKAFRKFVSVRRRNTTTTATESTAEPDSGLAELQAEPDVSPDSTERSEDPDAATKDDTAKTDTAVTADVAVTNTDAGEAEGIANTDAMPAPTVIPAPTVEFFEESATSSQQQVPAVVKNIHQRLAARVTEDGGLRINLLRLTEDQPADVVLTLLRCAPTCDRAAAMMWRAIGSSALTLEKVLPTLISVMEDWPVHRTLTSDGDNEAVLALAATLGLWVTVQAPGCDMARFLHSARLFVALLFHIVITTQQMPEEVANFWRACQQEQRLPSNPNRFAVQAMKALFSRKWYDKELIAMESKHGWDTLLSADTQHYAVGLLAREMRRDSGHMCSRIAFHLLWLLSREEPRWDLPFLAFLVEVLECLDWRKCADSILEVMSRHLQRSCRQRRRLALRGLVLLSKDPWMAGWIRSLDLSLLELLGDADGEVVGMSLSVLTNVFQNKDAAIGKTAAQSLAERLLSLFGNDNGHVQLLSMQLFQKVMGLVEHEGKKPLKRTVSQSLLPLFLHCHEVNRRVAKASRETLHAAAGFLKRSHLEQVLKTQKLVKFAECLLVEDERRAAGHLRWALPYLESPQKPLRQAAIRIIGIAGVLLMGQKEELQALSEALEALREDDSPSLMSLFVQVTFEGRAAELRSSASSEEPVS